MWFHLAVWFLGSRLVLVNKLSNIVRKNGSGNGLKFHLVLDTFNDLFVFDLKTFDKKDYKKLSQGIYDILEVEDENEKFLIFGQHYGNIDMLRETDLKKVF